MVLTWEILSLVSYYFLSSFFCSVDKKKCPKVSGVYKQWGFDARHIYADCLDLDQCIKPLTICFWSLNVNHIWFGSAWLVSFLSLFSASFRILDSGRFLPILNSWLLKPQRDGKLSKDPHNKVNFCTDQSRCAASLPQASSSGFFSMD